MKAIAEIRRKLFLRVEVQLRERLVFVRSYQLLLDRFAQLVLNDVNVPR